MSSKKTTNQLAIIEKALKSAIKEKNKNNINKYKARIDISLELNRPLFKIFSDYFNILKQNKKLQELNKTKVIGFFKDEFFIENVSLGENYGVEIVFLELQRLTISFTFSTHKVNNEVVYNLSISSEQNTNIVSNSIYKKILEDSIQESNLRGNYLTMNVDTLSWSISELEYRNLSDIFVPQKIYNDLELYINVFKDKKILMRYLMVGVPGSGKTESTIILMNELKKLGVTIIKTPICNYLQDKVELAQILAPSILIFDDIDLQLGSRKRGYSENLQLFLDVLDGTNKIKNNVGILATTNSVELLDLAAQRPGRFEEIISFDVLTKDNIKNIILKALKYEFRINANSNVSKLFTDPQIINTYFESKVTGAHVYNSTKMLQLRSESTKIEINIEWLISEINGTIKTIEKIRNTNYLTDKMNNKQKKSNIGFNHHDDDYDDDYDDDEDKIDRPSILRG